MTLVYLAAAWVIGIALAAWLALPTAFWLCLFPLPLALFVLWRHDSRLRLVHGMLLLLVAGAIRYQLALPSPSDQALAQFNDQGPVTFVGVVYDEPIPTDHYLQLRVDVSRIKRDHDWEDVSGRVLVQAPRDLPARYGDEVRIAGELTTPSDGADFSYRDFLARSTILSVVQARQSVVTMHDQGNPFFSALYVFKASALAALHTLFPEPAAALLSGILLGRDEAIPGALQAAFKSTNTGHIIAISGFNRTQT
ncbi:MAG: ComEC/Rec2 family competence protein [Anaerolineae bacterium]